MDQKWWLKSSDICGLFIWYKCEIDDDVLSDLISWFLRMYKWFGSVRKYIIEFL